MPLPKPMITKIPNAFITASPGIIELMISITKRHKSHTPIRFSEIQDTEYHDHKASLPLGNSHFSFAPKASPSPIRTGSPRSSDSPDWITAFMKANISLYGRENRHKRGPWGRPCGEMSATGGNWTKIRHLGHRLVILVNSCDTFSHILQAGWLLKTQVPEKSPWMMWVKLITIKPQINTTKIKPTVFIMGIPILV